MIGFTFWNCEWFLIPILLWNIVFASRLTQDGFRSDHLVPKAVLLTENIFRFAVFCFPLLLPVLTGHPLFTAGLILYLLGCGVYFLSWLPLVRAPRSKWSVSAAGILAPHITPLIALTGIAFIAQSPLYAALSAVFTGFHVLSGLYSFRFIRNKSRPAGRSSAHPRTGKIDTGYRNRTPKKKR